MRSKDAHKQLARMSLSKMQKHTILRKDQGKLDLFVVVFKNYKKAIFLFYCLFSFYYFFNLLGF